MNDENAKKNKQTKKQGCDIDLIIDILLNNQTLSFEGKTRGKIKENEATHRSLANVKIKCYGSMQCKDH